MSNGGVCQVPHPDYLLREIRTRVSAAETRGEFHCSACDQHYTKCQVRGDTTTTYEPETAQWCFQGPHTIEAIDDKRRVCKENITIYADPEDTTETFQAKLDAMDASKVRVLVIKFWAGCDDKIKPQLDLEMPLLEEVQLENVDFTKISFTAAKTPLLKRIVMAGVPDDCDIEISCPLLEDFSASFHWGDCYWLDDMIKAAKGLKYYSSYKLGVEELALKGKHLEEISIRRNDVLQKVSISAPKLQHLYLQGCYSLEKLLLVEGKKQTKFTVDTTNSCLSGQVERTLQRSKNAIWKEHKLEYED